MNRTAYKRFLKQPAKLSREHKEVAEKQFARVPDAFKPVLAKAMSDGAFTMWPDIGKGLRASIPVYTLFDYGGGLFAFWVVARGAINPADPMQTSLLEGELRSQAFKSVRFMQQNVGGFEKAFMVGTQPFFGFRGGPRIEGRHTLTVEEVFAETRFDDVLYRNVHEHGHGGPASGFDVPLRAVLPKKVDGLLVCGRGAAYERRGHDPSGMRARDSMMIFGECVGVAAAAAARDGVLPDKVDMRKVQKRLLKSGVNLGEPERLRELGLA